MQVTKAREGDQLMEVLDPTTKAKSIRCLGAHPEQATQQGDNTESTIVIPVPKEKQRSIVSGKKAEVICYGCGGLGHYKSNCPIVKFQNRVDMYWKGKARGGL
ncbi:putative reverse transcriptase domain-containing protein [Tanacetum coccineum]